MNQAERERLFLQLFHENRERILRLSHGYLNSAEDAEDLFQEIMTRAWNSLPGFRGEARLSTWLYRIAVNSALLYRRKRGRPAPLVDIAGTEPAAPEEMEKRERVVALRRAVAALNDQDRLIATLALEDLSYEDLSYKEISEITGISVNYVCVKMTRIRQALEESLKEYGYGRV